MTCRCGARSVCLCKAGTGIAEGEEPDQRRASASRCFCPLCALCEMLRCRSGTALGNVLWEENQTLGGPVASSAVGTLPGTGAVLPRAGAHSLCSQNPQDMSLMKSTCSSHACPQWVVSLPSALVKSKLRMTRPRKPLSPSPGISCTSSGPHSRLNLVSFACAVLALQIPTSLHFSGEQHYPTEPLPALWLIVTCSSLLDTLWRFSGSFDILCLRRQ